MHWMSNEQKARKNFGTEYGVVIPDQHDIHLVFIFLRIERSHTRHPQRWVKVELVVFALQSLDLSLCQTSCPIAVHTLDFF